MCRPKPRWCRCQASSTGSAWQTGVVGTAGQSADNAVCGVQFCQVDLVQSTVHQPEHGADQRLVLQRSFACQDAQNQRGGASIAGGVERHAFITEVQAFDVAERVGAFGSGRQGEAGAGFGDGVAAAVIDVPD